MSETKQVLRHAVLVVLLSAAAGFAARPSLVKKFLAGEFRKSFFIKAEFPAIRMISLQEAEDAFASGGAFVFMDARAESFFREGHVPGARSVPYRAGETRLPAAVLELPRSRGLIVYCEGGDCQSSLALAKLLAAAGFGDIRVVTGGWAEWTKAGLPQESGEAR